VGCNDSPGFFVLSDLSFLSSLLTPFFFRGWACCASRCLDCQPHLVHLVSPSYPFSRISVFSTFSVPFFFVQMVSAVAAYTYVCRSPEVTNLPHPPRLLSFRETLEDVSYIPPWVPLSSSAGYFNLSQFFSLSLSPSKPRILRVSSSTVFFSARRDTSNFLFVTRSPPSETRVQELPCASHPLPFRVDFDVTSFLAFALKRKPFYVLCFFFFQCRGSASHRLVSPHGCSFAPCQVLTLLILFSTMISWRLSFPSLPSLFLPLSLFNVD